MKRAVLAIAVVPTVLLAGCGGGSEDTFSASGQIIFTSIAGNVIYADSATAGDECGFSSTYGGFSEGAEAVVEDADGTRVAVGEVGPGTLASSHDETAGVGIVRCEATFDVPDIPAGDGIFVLKLGDEEVSFDQAEAGELEVATADGP